MEHSIDINLSQLRRDLRELAEESRSLKRMLRRRWTEPMADAQRKLVCVRRRTTRLLVLRAFTRGKLHLQSRPREFAVPGSDRYYEPCGDGVYRIRSWDLVESQRRIAEQMAKSYAPGGGRPERPHGESHTRQEPRDEVTP